MQPLLFYCGLDQLVPTTPQSLSEFGINIVHGIPRSRQLSITNFVPRLFPSQNASTTSAYSIIWMLRLSGAALLYLSYSGKNSVNLNPFIRANNRADVSTPFAPPETISAVSGGIYYIMKSKILSERSAMIQRALANLDFCGLSLQSKLRFHLSKSGTSSPLEPMIATFMHNPPSNIIY